MFLLSLTILRLIFPGADQRLIFLGNDGPIGCNVAEISDISHANKHKPRLFSKCPIMGLSAAKSKVLTHTVF